MEDGVRIMNENDTRDYVAAMRKGKQAIFHAWKAEWLAKVFPTLLARAKWGKTQPNVRTQTIGLLQYEAKFGADTWKLAKVVSVYPDSGGKVRTIQVQLGIRQGQQGGPSHLMEVAVQRFCPLFHPDDDGLSILHHQVSA